MPDTKQQLGIELNLTLNGDFEKLIEKIQKAFASINVSGGIKQIEAIEAAAKKSQTGVESFLNVSNAKFKLMEEGVAKYNASLKGTASVIDKATLSQANLDKAISSSSKTITEHSGGLVKLGNQLVTFQKQQSMVTAAKKEDAAREKVWMNETFSLYQKQDSMLDAQVRHQREVAKQNLDIIRNTEEAKRRVVAEMLAKGDSIMGAYRSAGAQPVNGGYVAKSAILSTDVAWSAAIKENAAREKAAMEDTFALYQKQDSMIDAKARHEAEVRAAHLAALKENAAREKAAMEETFSLYLKQDSMLDARYRHEAALAKQNLDIIKNTAAAKRQAVAEMLAKGDSVMGAYRNAGMQPVNGGYVAKTAVLNTDVAWSAAIKENDAISPLLPKIKMWEDHIAALRKQGLALWNGQVVSMKEYNQLLNKTNGLFDIFGTSIGKVAKHLVEFYAIRGVLFAVSNQIRTAVSDIISFNQALADTAGISNASEAGIRAFGLEAQAIARNSKMDLQEVMKLMNLLAQSGVKEQDVPFVSRVTAMFATGTGSSAENAVRVMTTSLNVWNIEASKAAVVANTLTAGLNSAKLEVNELSTVFNYLAPMAKQAGYSIQETTAIIATMSQMGVKASTIGTGTGQLLTRLMAPTKGVKDLAHAYNLELDQLNPRLHKFSDIIKTLQTADGGKAIPVQDLLRAFGQIAGRSASAAVTAGSEYFKEMERNVSLGNASLVAYSKVIEGTGAKLNMLRQSFVQLIGSVTQFNGVIGLGYEFLLSLIRGLTSSEGKVAAFALAFTGLATAIYSCRTALLAFNKANPFTIWMTLAGVAITALIAKLGSIAPETEKATRSFDRLAKDMGATQRGFQVLSEMYSKAAQAGKLNSDITQEHRQELIKLVNTTPALHGVIDISTKKYGELTKSIKAANEQMERLSDQNLSAYNSAIGRLQRAKDKRGYGGLTNSFNEDMAELSKEEGKALRYIDSRPKQAIGAADRAAEDAAFNKAKAELREQFQARRDKLITKFMNDPTHRADMDLASKSLGGATDAIPVDPSKPGDIYNLDFVPYKKGPAYKMEPSNTRPTLNPEIGNNTQGSMGAKLTAVDVSEIIRKYKNDTEEKLNKMTVDELETNLKTIMDDLKGEDDPAAYAEKKEAAQWYIKRLRTETLKAFKEEQYVKIANGFRAEYDPNSPTTDFLKFPNTDQGALDRKAYDAAKSKDPDFIKAQVNRQIESFGYLTSAGTDLRTTRVPDFKPTPYSSSADEKRADRILLAETRRLSIAKDLAATAEEVRQIELMRIDAERANSEEKLRIYGLEKDSLETRVAAGIATKAETERLDAINDQLRATNFLLDAQNAKYKDMANINFWYNFLKGLKESNKGLGDFKSEATTLGRELNNTLFNGLLNSLDENLTKLETLKWSWKDFGKSVGNVLVDMGKMIQHTILKMMLLAAWEKIAGLLSSTASAGGDFNSGSIYGQMANVSSSGPSMGPLMRAGGGLVPLNLGEPGKDSVKAYLTPGEVVLKKSSVDAIGLDRALYMNETGKIPGFANGGLVGGNSSNSAGDNPVGNLTIINVADASSIPPAQPNETQIVNIVSFAMQKNAAFKSQIKSVVNG